VNEKQKAGQIDTHPRLCHLGFVIQGQNTKDVPTTAASASIRSGVVRNEELVWLEAAQQKVDQLISPVQRRALPCPAEVCLDYRRDCKGKGTGKGGQDGERKGLEQKIPWSRVRKMALVICPKCSGNIWESKMVFCVTSKSSSLSRELNVSMSQILPDEKLELTRAAVAVTAPSPPCRNLRFGR
jgi:hypothetical protein